MGTGFVRGAMVLLGLVFAIAGPAWAVDLLGQTTATLQWTAASGAVAGYSVFVSRNGSTPTDPEQQLTSTTVTVGGALGDSIVVWVQAYDSLGRLGPASPNSDTYRFAAAAGSPAVLDVAPTTVSVSTPQGQSPASQSLSVQNLGTGTLSYRVSTSANWLVANPITGSATTETDTIGLTFSTAALSMGDYTGTVTLTDTVSLATKIVSVSLTVSAPGPVLSVEPTSLLATTVVGQNAAPLSLTLRNVGSGTLSYVLSDSATWLTIATPAGNATTEADAVTVAFSTSALAVGTYTATVAVVAPGATAAPLTIPVTLQVLSAPEFETSLGFLEASVAHGHTPPDQSFTVRNTTGGTLPYKIVSDASWLTTSPSVGASSGESDPISVRFDSAALTPGPRAATLHIVTNGAPDLVITVMLHVRPPTGDLDGDGVSETLLWSQSTGRLAALSHVFDSQQATGARITGPLPSQWQMLVSGDFDGDGHADLLWREDASGTSVICLMDGSTSHDCGAPATVPATDVLLGAADFNGDGRSDLVFRNPTTGTVSVCFLNALTSASCVDFATYPTDWTIVITGDLEGDGHADFVVQDPSNPRLQICSIWGVCKTATAFVGAELIGTGDYDGDGAADLLWLVRSGGYLLVSFPNLGGADAFRYLGVVPLNEEIVASVDLDGDGRSEILLRDPATGNVSAWFVNATGLLQETPLGLLDLDYTLGGSSPIQ